MDDEDKALWTGVLIGVVIGGMLVSALWGGRINERGSESQEAHETAESTDWRD